MDRLSKEPDLIRDLAPRSIHYYRAAAEGGGGPKKKPSREKNLQMNLQQYNTRYGPLHSVERPAKKQFSVCLVSSLYARTVFGGHRRSSTRLPSLVAPMRRTVYVILQDHGPKEI